MENYLSTDQSQNYGCLNKKKTKRVQSSPYSGNSGIRLDFIMNKLGFYYAVFGVLLLFIQQANAGCGPIQPCMNGGNCIYNRCECTDAFVGEHCQYRNPCYSSQCQNGGTCNYHITNQGPRFTCICPIGYSESLCEVEVPNACKSSPCANQGTCRLDTINSYHCICPIGFQGPTCEQVDHCSSKPCHNGGICESHEDGFKCKCPKGFIGKTCTDDIDECALDRPCVRGTCHNRHGSYRCECPVEYAGKNCESVYTPCSPSPCENHGKCVPYANFKYNCECLPGFTGRHCEVDIDDCINNLCQNGARCIDGKGNYTCECTEQFKGRYCTEDVDECNERPGLCKHGSTCVNTHASPDKPDGFHCICVNGWEGKYCEINKDDCAARVCYNGGTCHDLVGSFRCECPGGKTGLLCHLDDACMSNPCHAGAQCATNPVDGGYLCTCPKGFRGKDCSIDVDECANGSPCEHQGTCVNTPGSYKCECTPGYTGDWCETNINECASNPCQNDATCLDDVGKFICVCMPGYTGTYCEQYQRNDCVSNPCEHAGRCMNVKNGYKCVCAAGYTGANCETNIDDCASSPCQNGGTCIDEVNGYQCHCSFPFSGEKCELLNDPCRINRCQNGGSCRNTGGGQTMCHCPEGFKGRYCHEDVNECLASPCHNGGTCANLRGSYRCLCERGFTGKHCENNVNDCISKPCKNGGTCVDLVDGYKCDCKTGYGDPECGTDLDECASNPCLNGATCYDYVGYFVCACPAGFSGRLCQKNDQDCASGLCLNGGTCEDGVNRYKCHCPKGFGGRNCQSVVNETDYYKVETMELEQCKMHNCDRKSNDGHCDTECNFVGCNYDGQDCSAGLTPFENCTNPKLCSRVFHDGKCDEACNTEECLFDGYDCIRAEQSCNPLYSVYCQQHYGNGKCDYGCNTPGCGFDGGDCDPKSEEQKDVLAGSVVMVLLVEPETLLNQSRKFLMTLSKMVHANLKIKRDSDGDLMIYRWNSDDGLTTKVHVPESNSLNLIAASPDSHIISRKKRSVDGDTLTGTILMLTVDITKCVEDGRDDCFTDVMNVAAYLGAAAARDRLRRELGFPVYSAYGEIPPTEPAGTNNMMFGIISFIVILAVILIAILVVQQRKRKIINAPVWTPGGSGVVMGSQCSLDRTPSTKGSICGSLSHHGLAQPNTYESDANFRHGQCYDRNNGQYGTNLGHYLKRETDFGGEDYTYASPPIKKTKSSGEYGKVGIHIGDRDRRKWAPEHQLAANGKLENGMMMTNINAEGPDGQKPIHVIASNGRMDEQEQTRVLENFINQGADLNAKTDTNQDCALILATKYGRKRPVELMIQSGADLNEQDANGMAALHHAVLTNMVDIVLLLLTGHVSENNRAKVDLPDFQEMTALIWAAKMSHADTRSMELLLAHGASPGAVDQDGKTALHWAATHNNVSAVKLLLEKGANKDAQDQRDQTPLFLAAREGNLKTVEYLLTQGASKDITDQMDRTAITIAAENNHKMVVELLGKMPTSAHPFGPNTATLPHSARTANSKPKPPRRTKSMRDSGRAGESDRVTAAVKGRQSKSQERRPSISLANGGQPIHPPGMMDIGGVGIYSPHSDQSPPSFTDSPLSAGSSSNFGPTPSPGSTLRCNSQNFNVPSSNGKTPSSCAMMSPYSNPGSSSGLSPQQPAPYRSPPPPYSSLTRGEVPSGGSAATYQRSPLNYGQSPPQYPSSAVPELCSVTADYYEGLDSVTYQSNPRGVVQGKNSSPAYPQSFDTGNGGNGYMPNGGQTNINANMNVNDFYVQAQSLSAMGQHWELDDGAADMYQAYENGTMAC